MNSILPNLLEVSRHPTVPDARACSKELCRVLHLINGEHFSGAERVQDLLAIALPDFGYRVDFACLKLNRFSKVRQSDTALFDLNMRSILDLAVARKVVRLVKEHGYKILHAHTPRTLLVGSLVSRWLELPLVYHVHSPVGRDSTRKFRNRINAWVETHCLKSANAMVCVSASLASYMKQLGHDPGKLHVVLNGVPTCHDLNGRKPPCDVWTLGTMALFRPRKGIETLLEAMAMLKQEGLNIRLRAVGGFESSDYQLEIMRLVRKLEIDELITWTGFQTDINAQLHRMDLFVLPSLFGEGLPMVVLESMAQGVPVIASNVEGIPEAIQDGVDGLIFDAGSAVNLADRIRSIYGDRVQWASLRNSSLRRQRELLSEKSMAGGVAAVYDQLRRLD